MCAFSPPPNKCVSQSTLLLPFLLAVYTLSQKVVHTLIPPPVIMSSILIYLLTNTSNHLFSINESNSVDYYLTAETLHHARPLVPSFIWFPLFVMYNIYITLFIHPIACLFSNKCWANLVLLLSSFLDDIRWQYGFKLSSCLDNNINRFYFIEL